MYQITLTLNFYEFKLENMSISKLHVDELLVSNFKQNIAYTVKHEYYEHSNYEFMLITKKFGFPSKIS